MTNAHDALVSSRFPRTRWNSESSTDEVNSLFDEFDRLLETAWVQR